MKSLKSVVLIGAAALAAALFVGASGSGATHKGIPVEGEGDGGARPDAVRVENWIPLNEKAGFALTNLKGDSVGAELYLKTDGGWRRGRVENPVMALPVRR